MTDQELVSAIMDKTSSIKYKEEYEEEDIIAYYNSRGMYVSIEEHLKNCIAKKQS